MHIAAIKSQVFVLSPAWKAPFRIQTDSISRSGMIRHCSLWQTLRSGKEVKKGGSGKEGRIAGTRFCSLLPPSPMSFVTVVEGTALDGMRFNTLAQSVRWFTEHFGIYDIGFCADKCSVEMRKTRV